MKVHSWSKHHTFQSVLHMLSANHLNIDGPPFPVKCVRKFGSALGGEVVCVCVRVCVCTYMMWMCQERTLCIFYTCEVRTFDQEQTHSRSAVSFSLRFGLVILGNPGIDHKIMEVA